MKEECLEAAQKWLDFAYSDLSAAEYLCQMHPVPIEIICYHCEQAADFAAGSGLSG